MPADKRLSSLWKWHCEWGRNGTIMTADQPIPDLLAALRREFENGPTRPCPECGRHGAHGPACRVCIAAELTRRGVPGEQIIELAELLENMRDIRRLIAARMEEIRETVGG